MTVTQDVAVMLRDHIRDLDEERGRLNRALESLTGERRGPGRPKSATRERPKSATGKRGPGRPPGKGKKKDAKS